MVRRVIEGSGEKRLETWVSYILITGVVISLVLEVAGMVLFYRASHSFAVSQDAAAFVRGQGFFTFIVRLLHETSTGITGLRLMILGIAVLILTPYIRAVMSVVYFASTKNVKYFIITLFVLAILTISLWIH